MFFSGSTTPDDAPQEFVLKNTDSIGQWGYIAPIRPYLATFKENQRTASQDTKVASLLSWEEETKIKVQSAPTWRNMTN
ncbi:hypothetical protein M422DRAFT_269216 [Sphaerobolus stellatus SS14]|uniref:Uncharacterized protein n=1 Tax=Sphaerobolus stellatus (strain SS14) TaxID=990650 RepID=A0A0C9U565_SPHS4|nr:hypothetical protein M422DRAFT_269216 [Sphaerobolus stellatus SS14]